MAWWICVITNLLWLFFSLFAALVWNQERERQKERLRRELEQEQRQ